ncbi:MAG: hypothetical protein KAT90_07995, partial [Gammaproteobacteria bacterium]|nr:hypothetical protein [Gammaproteobacteria bacterium]
MSLSNCVGVFLRSNFNQKNCRLIITLLGLFILSSCSNGNNDSPQALVTKTIGIDGGTVAYTTEDGTNTTVNIKIPAGALDEDIDITISKDGNYPDDSTIVKGTVFTFGPDGLLFNIDADLSITYEDTNVPADVPESDLAIHKLIDGVWSEFSTSSDGVSNTTITQIPGFSKWAVLQKKGGSTSMPRATRSFTATAGDTVATLSWQKVTGADSYNLYYDTLSGVTTASTVITGVTSPYDHTGLTNDATYYYIVTAVNANGEGLPSNEISVTPVLAPPTGVVSNFVAIAGDDQASLNWDAVSNTDGYNIYRSLSSNNYGAALATNISATSFVDTTAINDTTYFYVVAAQNLAGEGSLSIEQSVTPLLAPPAQVNNLLSAAGNAQVSLNWDLLAKTDSYYVDRSEISGDYGAAVRVQVFTNSYTDTTVANGTTYYYVVSGANTAGEGLSSLETSASPQVPAPGTPTSLGTIASDANVDLSWNATTGATGYNIYRSTTSGTYSTVLVNTAGTTYSDTTVSNGITYYYVITAVNPGGESPNSSEVSASPQVPAPVAPIGLGAIASDANVDLAWSATTGATAYNIYRSTTSGSYGAVLVSTASIAYSDTTVSNGSTYYYVVTATNPGGESPVSSEIVASPQVPVPATPTGLGAIAGDTVVDLAWSATTGATSYNIYRSTTSASYGAILANTAGTTYSDTTVSNDITYYYVIEATNPGGVSPLSSEVGATPQIPPPPVTPVGFRAQIGNASLKLRWITSPGATSYNLYRSTSSAPLNVGNLLVSGITTNYYVDSTAPVGTAHYYYLSAVNTGGEGTATIELSATPAVIHSSISTGLSSMVVRDNGTLWGWGHNGSGQLGVSSATLSRSLPPIQNGTGSAWASVASSTYGHALALQTDGTLFAWGNNSSGQLGIGNTSTQSVPQPVGSAQWLSFFIGGNNSAGIQADGSLWTWGQGYQGRLGTGSTVNATLPQAILEVGPWDSVSVGSSRTLAIKADGTLWAWGYDLYGKHGQGNAGVQQQDLPVQIGTDTDWVQVSVGSASSYYTSMAVKADGTLWAWGYDNNGAFGADTLKYTVTTPLQIGTAQWSMVKTSGSHTLGIKKDGTLWSWGYNSVGQLGTGTNGGYNATPAQIGSATNWVSISVESNNTMALQADNSLSSWGDNSRGQIGLGTSGQPWSPQDMSSAFTQISKGYYHSAGIKADGTLWVWGQGGSGQLGLGSVITRTQVPTQIGVDTWTQVSAGNSHTQAIRSDGTL